MFKKEKWLSTMLIMSAILSAGMSASAAKLEKDQLAFSKSSKDINIRTQANTDTSTVVAKLHKNNAVTVLDIIDDEWCFVSSGDAIGYMKSKYLLTGEEAQKVADEVAYNVAVVQSKALNVRAKADSESKVIDVVESKQMLEVVEYNGGAWMKVALAPDSYGYVDASYCGYKTYYSVAEVVNEEALADVEIPDLIVADTTASEETYSAETQETVAETPAVSEEYQEPAAEETTYEETQDTSYEEPAYEETQDTTYEEPVYEETQDTTYEEPVYEETQDTSYEEPVYEETQDTSYEEPVYEETQDTSYDEPAYEENQDTSYEETANEEEQSSYDEEASYDDGTSDEYSYSEDEQEEEMGVADEDQGEITDGDDGDLYITSDESADAQGTEDDQGEYASEDYTDESATSSDSSTGQAIADYALQYVGNPYVYGGTSLTNGTDCSGFTQSVMSNYGVDIARVAADQANGGTSVDLEDVEAGDLLFYSDGSGISHVGIYIGDGQIVHASTEETGIIVSDANYSTPVSAARYW